MRVRLLIVATFLSALALPARADFMDGLAAYDAGDYAAAVEEWKPLAVTGNADAQVALAGLYAVGNGVAQSPSKAAYWYERAARQGHPVGQLNIGDYYARGVGVLRDPVAAYFWLSLAAKQGRDWAAQRRDEVVAGLPDAEKDQVKNRLATWITIPEMR